jgi:hypothetical protein
MVDVAGTLSICPFILPSQRIRLLTSSSPYFKLKLFSSLDVHLLPFPFATTRYLARSHLDSANYLGIVLHPPESAVFLSPRAGMGVVQACTIRPSCELHNGFHAVDRTPAASDPPSYADRRPVLCCKPQGVRRAVQHRVSARSLSRKPLVPSAACDDSFGRMHTAHFFRTLGFFVHASSRSRGLWSDDAVDEAGQGDVAHLLPLFFHSSVRQAVCAT